MKRAWLSFFIIFLLALSFGVGSYFLLILKFQIQTKQQESNFAIPQTDIVENVDNVRTLLLFHAADYFVYRGFPIGFQYEMLRELEKGIGRNVEIIVETQVGKINKELFAENYDIVVMDVKYSGFILPMFKTSIPHSYSYPVLVSGDRACSVSDSTIFVSEDFSAMLFFADDSPYSQFLVQKSNNSTEELFEKVDNGEIHYLICDYNQAITLMPFYSQVQILAKAGPQFERR